MQTEKNHILITGPRGIGKTTLAAKVVSEADIPIYGYVTRTMDKDEAGKRGVYLFSASLPIAKQNISDENRIGMRSPSGPAAFPEVFETLGVALLDDAKDDGIILMDELGFMERDAKHFQEKVLEKLDGDSHVIAVVKDRRDIPFLEKIRTCQKAEIFEVTEENRDILAARLMEIVRQWNI